MCCRDVRPAADRRSGDAVVEPLRASSPAALGARAHARSRSGGRTGRSVEVIAVVTDPRPYNPLDLTAIAHNIEATLLQQAPQPMPPSKAFQGAGIYAIYYLGDFGPYKPVSSAGCTVPIYVGRALPPGARQGKVGIGEAPGPVLFNRLREHSRSIEQARNLDLSDFRCRYLVVEDLFVALGERLTIQHFRPLWNQVVDGFGNHDPGAGRRRGKRSEWDVLHPGRPWADKLAVGRTRADVVKDIKDHLKAHKAAAPPPGSTTTPIPPPPDSD